jgi:hypothetical protein
MLEVSNSIVTWICWQCLRSVKSVVSGRPLATCGAQGAVGCARRAKKVGRWTLGICKRDWSTFPADQYPWRSLDRELSMLTHLLSEER